MLCYMLSHEAHHRGQVCMLAHQLGFPLPIEVTSGLWNWRSCGKSAGPAGPATILRDRPAAADVAAHQFLHGRIVGTAWFLEHATADMIWPDVQYPH